MHMHVNKSRHDITVFGIQYLICLPLDLLCDFRNFPVFNIQIRQRLTPALRIDHNSVFDQ